VSATVADSLDVIAPYLPPALLSTGARRDIWRVARRLPAQLSECLGFELPLGDRRARGDFAVQVSTPRGRRLLGDAGRTPEFPTVAGDEWAWARIRRFARTWCDDDSPLARHVTSAWLEFDVDSAGGRHRIPSIFMRVTSVRADEVLRCVADSIELLGGAPLPGASRDALARCVDALPARAELHQVGTMLSRRFVPLRLCVAGLGTERMPGFLADVGLARAGERAREIGETLLDDTGDVMLQLDVVDGLRPGFGVEYSVTANRELDGRPETRWAAFLDRLVARGLCTPTKRRGILAWAGASREQFTHQPCPTRVYRGLSHVKLDCSTDGPPVPKAYIGFIPDRLTLLFAGTA
jgi:hypothetical protein